MSTINRHWGRISHGIEFGLFLMSPTTYITAVICHRVEVAIGPFLREIETSFLREIETFCDDFKQGFNSGFASRTLRTLQPEVLSDRTSQIFGGKEISFYREGRMKCVITDLSTGERSIQNRSETMRYSDRVHNDTKRHLPSRLGHCKITYVITRQLQVDAEYESKRRALNNECDRAETGCILTASGAVGVIALGVLCPPLAIAGVIGGGIAFGVKCAERGYAKQHLESLDSMNRKAVERRMEEIRESHLPYLLECEPISASSLIDPRYLVSPFRWAVTLIGYLGPDGNHAQLIAEGIEEGEYCMKLAHLKGGSEIICTEKVEHPERIHYDQRTQIWKVPAKKIKKLFKNIKREQEEGMFFPIVQNGYGPNCFTYLKRHLKDAEIVDLGKKTFLGTGLFPERLKNYTTLGNSVFQHWYVEGHGAFVGVPFAPQVMWNNFHDQHDHSVSVIRDRESL